jgi:hypothetical protein
MIHLLQHRAYAGCEPDSVNASGLGTRADHPQEGTPWEVEERPGAPRCDGKLRDDADPDRTHPARRARVWADLTRASWQSGAPADRGRPVPGSGSSRALDLHNRPRRASQVMQGEMTG